jgi:NAD(P)-dependent dehydrogenase (short-subunit alcohol dehydrogenase family)
MTDFRGKTAVVTGAARGIGLAIAGQCVAEGMNVVLADIDTAALADAEAQLRQTRGEVLAVRTDVAAAASVQALARATMDRFGEVTLLFNNAGVAAAGDHGELWRTSHQDWHRLVDVNLWGVIHGCTSFLPLMVEQSTPSRIVNMASIAGLLAPPPIAIYAMTKHAIIGLSESLAAQLEDSADHVRVCVVCPGFVRTGLAEQRAQAQGQTSPDADKRTWFERKVAEGTDPDELACKIFAGIRQDRLFIFPHTEYREAVAQRFRRILDGFDYD